MSKDLVEKFNALPRNPRSPSGWAPNEWHFDVRYVQLEPNPAHVVFFFQPQSHLIYTLRLPIDLASDEVNLKFFPETAKEAAPTVVKGILRAFVDNMGRNDRRMYPEPPSALAPWKLMTDDKALATAVGHELKRVGVKSEALWDISISSETVVDGAMQTFGLFFRNLVNVCVLDDTMAAIVQTPGPIVWEGCRVPKAVSEKRNDLDDEENSDFRVMLEYTTLWATVLPSDGTEYEAKRYQENREREFTRIETLLKEKPERIINAAADRGDADAALDYGMRLTVGLGCKRNRKRARDYLVKAAHSESASKTIKAMAHGVLIEWYLHSDRITPRYAFAASHHCNEAAQLCAEVSGSDVCASPAVLWFMKKTFKTLAEDVPEFYIWFIEAVDALEARDRQYEENQAKIARKRALNASRYRCAAPGCEIEADKGSKLSRCSGPCDIDKKPYYCTQECQREDWRNHKPFCRPGAESSVIDDGTKYDLAETSPARKTVDGALMIPITFRESGKTLMVCSTTMDAKMLKEMKRYNEMDIGQA
ncbi:hypothetical protein JR316_0002569 [Psilocybe cubensis]|uniref:Uncharacterized protein n=2 Tax=Psilocybe cubensis TaxID=181762 RepID=A0ACB8HEQ9_PSICU|nr:hypothetical protein JR316_0002569 [Psilocybe cubensis]KAH9485659.1 hypothetical protein JR316_0002569 [Psilocybe cubensis]